MLIAARCIQGIGGALSTPGSLSLLSAAYDDAVARPRDRPLVGLLGADVGARTGHRRLAHAALFVAIRLFDQRPDRGRGIADPCAARPREPRRVGRPADRRDRCDARNAGLGAARLRTDRDERRPHLSARRWQSSPPVLVVLALFVLAERRDARPDGALRSLCLARLQRRQYLYVLALRRDRRQPLLRSVRAHQRAPLHADGRGRRAAPLHLHHGRRVALVGRPRRADRRRGRRCSLGAIARRPRLSRLSHCPGPTGRIGRPSFRPR